MSQRKQTLIRLVVCMFVSLLIGILLNIMVFQIPLSEVDGLHSLAYLVSIYCVLLIPAAALAMLLAWVQADRWTHWVFLAIAACLLASAEAIMPISQNGFSILLAYGFGLAIFSLYSFLKPSSGPSQGDRKRHKQET